MISLPTACIFVMTLSGFGALLPWWEYSQDWTYWPAAALLGTALGALAPLLAGALASRRRESPKQESPQAASQQFFEEFKLLQFRNGRPYGKM